MITSSEDLLGRRLDDAAVRSFIASLGEVVESQPEQEQGSEHYVAVLSAGFEAMSENGIVQAVTLYRGDLHDYGPYSGVLPFGVQMGWAREKVRARLGRPEFEMEARDHPYLNRRRPMDRYDRSGVSVAIEYDEASLEVVIVQLLLPGAVPRGEA